MTDKPKIPYAVAYKLACELRDVLLPFCEKVEIVGSLRRKRPTVGDIELLFIGKRARRKVDLLQMEDYDTAGQKIDDLLNAGILAKRPSVTGGTAWGLKNRLGIHVASGIACDFFATTPDCWWNALVVRTGGKDTNLVLTTTAQKRGWKFHAYGNGFTHLRTNEHHRTTSEADVFEFLGLRCLAPEQRR